MATGSSSRANAANASTEHLLSSGKTTLRTDHKHPIYSIAALPDVNVLAAAGGKGCISFWPGDTTSALAQPHLDPDEDGNVLTPLLSAKAHKRWISEIICVKQAAPDPSAALLLSASDDSSIVLSRFELKTAASGGGKGSLVPVVRQLRHYFWDEFLARVSAPRAPCGMPYFVCMLIGCWLVLLDSDVVPNLGLLRA